MEHLGCLLCEHFKPEAPNSWKPDYSGDVYHAYEARKEIKRTNLHQPGWCMLNPEYIKVTTGHVCGQIKLQRFAVTSLHLFIWGTYDEQRVETAEEKAKELTRQLKVAREISHNRLKKIQKLKGKTNRPKPNLVLIKNEST